jgi:hypothetical protein
LFMLPACLSESKRKRKRATTIKPRKSEKG